MTTGKSRVEDPRKNRGSKTHGRSVLKIVVMGLGVFLLLPMGLRATFWVYFQVITLVFFAFTNRHVIKPPPINDPLDKRVRRSRENFLIHVLYKK